MLEVRKLWDDTLFPPNRRSESSAETLHLWPHGPNADARDPPHLTKESKPTPVSVFIPAQSNQSVILNEMKDPAIQPPTPVPLDPSHGAE